jgi:hypothetical protein
VTSDDWIEPGDDLTPEEWEAARRDIEQEMEQRYPGWRGLYPEEKVRLFNEYLASVPGQKAQLEQEVALSQDASAFADLLHEKLKAEAARSGLSFPLPREAWIPLFFEAIEEQFGGMTTLAMNVCRSLGYKFTDDWTPKEDRVFEE